MKSIETGLVGGRKTDLDTVEITAQRTQQAGGGEKDME